MENLISDKELLSLIENFFLKTTLLVCSKRTNQPDSFTEYILNQNETDYSQLVPEFPHIFDMLNPWVHNDYRVLGENDTVTQLHLPPLIIETVLNIRNVPSNQWIKLRDTDGNPWNVCKGTKKSEIVLERWLIELDNTSQMFKNSEQSSTSNSIEKEEIHTDPIGFTNESNTPSSASPDLKKQMSLLFRYLRTFINLLPANDLYMSLKEQNQTLLSIDYKIFDGTKTIVSKGRIGLSKPIINTYMNIMNETNVSTHLEQRKVTPVWTKLGLLRVSVSYRHDCKFEVGLTNKEIVLEKYNDQSLDRYNFGKSSSISPQDNTIPIRNRMDHGSFQRRDFNSGTRIVQPFKTGSMGSPQLNNFHSLNTNNLSSSIIHSTVRSQKSRNNSISAYTSNQNMLHQPFENLSSTSKYSSSFGKLRRHSSIKSNLSLEKPDKFLKQNELHTVPPSDDLIEFVKLIDEKPELKLSEKQSLKNSDSINTSITKFKKLKVGNDILSDNLSMSVSLEQKYLRNKSRSSSHSPIPSVSPTIQFISIPSKVFEDDINEEELNRPPRSREGSFDRSKNYSIHQKIGGILNGKFTSKYLPSQSPLRHDDDNELLFDSPKYSNNQNLRPSPSLYSVDSIPNSFPKSKFPIQKTSNLSFPITATVPAYGNIHRPSLRSTDLLAGKEEVENLPNFSSDSNLHDQTHINTSSKIQHSSDDEDDMVFFMSEMHLHGD
ncbi:hypothetical protein TBLA_0B04950 [Henningerozyma blattae CBS 6284]|uniref:Autophagy-related protein 13 n=1 Tax=Henningerozyma blattae (strain ATCC 34711 / CBS 6284 / DSM 70876 / NBRC 10599 / NRRL Y-10934 / UCD 77-7) TaxID=1071380 RepID=I2GYX8_HENB6|nr:hypothetical protein TBLA_0B04950 [Tetrapisispora blattae CBS 6284]CCH59330.1 hypothetical protein TBLA_0B04950 [Tetrapisispora blattae CBS 6284]